ncbi:DUF1778 domain-containing protein [Phenylobacterium sp.]|uniref:type II toxin-antitoxin system TacA family antitoxin n=1 Tax=Phenylobacterium sp. TaxID=1871053 RepID=UPI0025FB1FC5|nr:DUF1778 domain-containing protein [Phenylobacterium sp.]MBX3483357.1 DUF1778 domain-containing protein [Phenylobacterium sp.]
MSAQPKRETLNLRIKPEVRDIIDRAAELQGRSRTDFVLDAARRAAEEALRDQPFIMVSREAYDAFLKRLDEPPNPNARLRKSLSKKPAWE